MSRKIKTRNYVQCRTHHQKMIEKYGCIEAIIKNHLYLFDQKDDKLDGISSGSNGTHEELNLEISEWKSVDQILNDSMLSSHVEIDHESCALIR